MLCLTTACFSSIRVLRVCKEFGLHICLHSVCEQKHIWMSRLLCVSVWFCVCLCACVCGNVSVCPHYSLSSFLSQLMWMFSACLSWYVFVCLSWPIAKLWWIASRTTAKFVPELVGFAKLPGANTEQAPALPPALISVIFQAAAEEDREALSFLIILRTLSVIVAMVGTAVWLWCLTTLMP